VIQRSIRSLERLEGKADLLNNKLYRVERTKEPKYFSVRGRLMMTARSQSEMLKLK
jgi:hypothetical protein